MSPAELAEHRAELAALAVARKKQKAEAARLEAAAVATFGRFADQLESAAEAEPDPLRRRVSKRAAEEIRKAIATTWPANPLPRVRNVRPLAAWQSRRETEAAGRNSDALAVSPRRAGAP